MKRESRFHSGSCELQFWQYASGEGLLGDGANRETSRSECSSDRDKLNLGDRDFIIPCVGISLDEPASSHGVQVCLVWGIDRLQKVPPASLDPNGGKGFLDSYT
jgi:hypothetical protein